jgi:pimeloyl-ACP methyl ester carboxylesterase
MVAINELTKLTIGNCPQYVAMHGMDTTNPILLMLHGGPGMPQIGFIRHFTQALENEFVVVNWDQRGAGKSYNGNIDKNTMHINQFVDDTIELTNYLLKRFNKQKVYLVGHSWGTAIGLMTIKLQPQLFELYVGVSQIVNMQAGEKISYNYTLDSAHKANNNKALADLKRIGNPPYKTLADNLLQRKWLDTFNGSTYNVKMNALMKPATSFKAYNLWDWAYRFRKGMYFSLECLLNDLLDVQLDKTVTEVNVPVYFFEGLNDYQVPFELAQEYFTKIKAPSKQIVLFENCGHMIPFEQPQKFCESIIALKKLH